MLAVFIARETTFTDRMQSLVGIGVLVLISWLLSSNRAAVKWKPVAWGIALQLLFGLVVLQPILQEYFFNVCDAGIHKLLSFSEQGANFVFQTVEPHQILDSQGVPVTYIGRISPPLKTFAFWILPSIVFFSALTSLLYHLGVMQWVVLGMSWVMQRTMGTSGAETLSAAANIFLGQTEAPLVVRPYIPKMTRSELHAVMVGGFATVAGGVLAAYVGFLKDIPGIAGHLMTASILSAPAALAISKIMEPETEVPLTLGVVRLHLEKSTTNILEAIAVGAAEGMKLAINVAAMLMAFVAMVAMVDWMLAFVPFMGEPLSMSRILGWIFFPIAIAMGVPFSEASAVGGLLGDKLVLTEFIAYIHLGQLTSSATAVLSERSAVISSYALCGFANFASIGIQLGGLGGMAPDRMRDLASLVFRAMIAGSIASFLTGNIVGLFGR